MTAPAEEEDSRTLPAWMREIGTSLSINSQIVLYGNVRDNFLVPAPDGWELLKLEECLWRVLSAEGYPYLLVADVIDGAHVVPEAAVNADSIVKCPPGGERMGLGALRKILQDVTGAKERRVVAVDYASRLTRQAGRLTDDEQHFFAACERMSHEALPRTPPGGASLYNPVIWIVRNERDLPEWLTAGNDTIRKISVPRPDFGDRRTAACILTPRLAGYAEASKETRLELQERFAEQTQGLTVRGMTEITRLAKRQRIPLEDIEEAVRCYRVGVYDNPWRRKHLRERLAGAAESIGSRVRGQDEAIQHCVDILVRSVLGLSGAHTSGSASRPRGVLFLAGPTGVGKTQLAKELTQLIFGDEQAYIRFDMSEFAAEHAADRLIGAPPGYVGHDAGGELTNAIRERPFSLLLFDEIEKAHPRILDKFLQILDDGRLTDGSGSTVYFSETVLVFTSNLGVSAPGPNGTRVPTVTDKMSRADIEQTVRAGVKAHFFDKLNRPELFNRLGDNVVVFNFIDAAAAEGIFDLLVKHVVQRLEKEQGVHLNIDPCARMRLLEITTADTTLGGRGIGSVLETAFVNPLARTLFTRGIVPGTTVTVTDVTQKNGTWELTVT